MPVESRRTATIILSALLLLGGLAVPRPAAAAPRSLATTTTMDGHPIPVNPVTGIPGVGSVCVEMHLATDSGDPFGPGKYLETEGLAAVGTWGGRTGDYSTLGYTTPQKGGTGRYPGGAYGYMAPEQERWYLNMRWTYATWVQVDGHTRARDIDWASLTWHKQHRKVLVTNLSTGLRAVGYMGDSGPGLELGQPAGNRIGGLSPDLMYYLSNQAGEEGTRTAFGRDDATDYRFEWLEDQSVPLGPLDGSVRTAAYVPPAPKAAAIAVPAPPAAPSLLGPVARYFAGWFLLPEMPGIPLPAALHDAGQLVGGDYALIVRDYPTGGRSRSDETTALPLGSRFPVLEESGGRYLLDTGTAERWVPADAVLLTDDDRW